MGATAIERLLSSHGFELARQRKHKVYKREDGTTFVTASTPSDRRAERNQISTLSRVLGVEKRSLFATLERRRTHKRNPTPEPSAPEMAAPTAVRPTVVVEKSATRGDRRLAKRLERIERDRSTKAEKLAERQQLFFDHLAVQFVDSGETVFADNRGVTRLKRLIARRIERPKRPTFELADRYDGRAQVDAMELLTNPDLMCLFNCPHCGVSFVFKDGSLLSVSRDEAMKLRDEGSNQTK
jgi:predicted RNA binding protein YcfA (HicA-like mRNA interferase family)